MEVVDQFIRYLHTEKRFSPHTTKAYRADLEQFLGYFGIAGSADDIAAITNRQIRSWVMVLVDSKIAPASINRKITSLRRFFRYCQQTGLMHNNPADLVSGLKSRKSLPVFVEKKPMGELISGVNSAEDFPGVRNALIIELLYGTGIRLSELTGLRHRDVMLEKGQVRVMGKRSKERIIPAPGAVLELIGRYVDLKHELHDCSGEAPLLVTDKGRPLYPVFVYRLVRRLLEFAGNTGKNSPHVLRHTYATHLLNEGADLNAIKELLGHANLSATQVYTHTQFEKLKIIYQKAHPRA